MSPLLFQVGSGPAGVGADLHGVHRRRGFSGEGFVDRANGQLADQLRVLNDIPVNQPGVDLLAGFGCGVVSDDLYLPGLAR